MKKKSQSQLHAPQVQQYLVSNHERYNHNYKYITK